MIRTAAGLIDLIYPSLSKTMMPSVSPTSRQPRNAARRDAARSGRSRPTRTRASISAADTRTSRALALGGAVSCVLDATGRDDRRRVYPGADQCAHTRVAQCLVGGTGRGSASAAGFQLVTTPFTVVPMMASLTWLTKAASYLSAASFERVARSRLE